MTKHKIVYVSGNKSAPAHGRLTDKVKKFKAKIKQERKKRKRIKQEKRTRIGYSMTKTTTKTKNSSGSSVQDGIGSTVIVINGRKLSNRVKTTGIWKHSQNHNVITVTGTGRQATVNTAAAGSIAQHLTNTGTGYAWDQAETAYKFLNPFLTNTGSILWPSVLTPSQDRYCVLSYTFLSEISNFTGHDAFVDYYVLKCKKLNSIDPFTQWQNSISDDSFGVGIAGFPGPGNGTIGTAGTQNVDNPGAVPHENREWNQFWKKCAFKRIRLGGGAVHRVTTVVRDQHQINTAVLTRQTTVANKYFPGTYVIMCIQRGAVDEDTTTPGTAKCTFGATRIGYVNIVKSKFCGVAAGTNRLDTTFAYTGIPTAALAVNEQFMDIGDTVKTFAAAVLPS